MHARAHAVHKIIELHLGGVLAEEFDIHLIPGIGRGRAGLIVVIARAHEERARRADLLCGLHAYLVVTVAVVAARAHLAAEIFVAVRLAAVGVLGYGQLGIAIFERHAPGIPFAVETAHVRPAVGGIDLFVLSFGREVGYHRGGVQRLVGERLFHFRLADVALAVAVLIRVGMRGHILVADVALAVSVFVDVRVQFVAAGRQREHAERHDRGRCHRRKGIHKFPLHTGFPHKIIIFAPLARLNIVVCACAHAFIPPYTAPIYTARWQAANFRPAGRSSRPRRCCSTRSSLCASP